MAPPTPVATPDEIATGRAAEARMAAEDWARAVAHLGCTEAQRMGWLTDDWRKAWWMQRDAAARWDVLYGDEPGLLVKWRGEGPGAVWLYRHAAGVRWYAASVLPRGPEITDKWALRDLAATLHAELWLWWFNVYEGVKTRKEWTLAVAGAPALVTWGTVGAAMIGPVTRTAKGIVVAIMGPDGEEVDVTEPRRSWAFGSRWREAAEALIKTGAVSYKSAGAAQWAVVHQRNRMVKAGELEPWVTE